MAKCAPKQGAYVIRFIVIGVRAPSFTAHKTSTSQIIFLLCCVLIDKLLVVCPTGDSANSPTSGGVSNLMNFLSEQAQESTLIGPEWGLRQTLIQQSRCSAIVLCGYLLTDVFSTLLRGGKWVNEQLTSFLMARCSALNAEAVLLPL